jgi:Ca-activated chloride channel family protein
MRNLLARTLFALATANLALVGCNAPKSAPHADPAKAPDGVVREEEKKDEATESGAKVAQTAGVVGQMAGSGASAPYTTMPAPVDGKESADAFKDYGVNGWSDTDKDKLSTFAADVDTASYTIARRKLTEGVLPPTAAVRVEEFVNYFKYAYAAPDSGRPFAVHVDVAPSPFNKGRQIVRVGVSTKARSVSERKAANLVFLVDTSGSMQSADKLDLAKRALRVLVDNLKDGDTVSLVTYAGDTRVVLEPTGLDGKAKILSAIEDLSAGGSTAMASGLELAYQQAATMMKPGTITRVLVLSDGDANVGNTSHEDMLKTIEAKVREGVTLSTVGFGQGNYKDETMEQLADKGNGNSFYIDGISAAKRIFQEQLGSTLEVVAQDVKLQVEFDPRIVARYRLVGYENRDIADADFRKDEVDAGEIGAGHQVTALYEIEARETMTADVTPADMVTVRVRAKEPAGTKASESEYRLAAADVAATFDGASDDLRFAFAVAAFADVLRGSEDSEHWSLAQIRDIAAGAAGTDADRAELVALIDQAISLSGGPKTALAK